MKRQLGFVPGEAVRNLGIGHALQAVCFFLVLFFFAMLTGMTANGALSQEHNLVAAGSHTITVTPPKGEFINGALCDSLNSLDGVIAAGGITQAQQPGWTPFSGGSELPWVGITPYGLRVWGVDPPLTSPAAGQDFTPLGLVSSGQTLIGVGDPTARLEIGQVLPVSLTNSRLNSLILIPQDPASLDLSECWVKVVPAMMPVAESVLQAQFGESGVTVRPFLSTNDLTLSPLAQWENYLGIQPWLVCALVVAVPALLFGYARRKELAVYRAMGASKLSTAMLSFTESMVLLGVTASLALSAALVTLAVMSGFSFENEALWATCLLTGAAVLASAGLLALLSWIGAGGKTMELLKDR